MKQRDIRYIIWEGFGFCFDKANNEIWFPIDDTGLWLNPYNLNMGDYTCDNQHIFIDIYGNSKLFKCNLLFGDIMTILDWVQLHQDPALYDSLASNWGYTCPIGSLRYKIYYNKIDTETEPELTQLTTDNPNTTTYRTSWAELSVW